MDDTLKKEFARFLRDYFSEGKEKIVSDETMAADWKIGHKEVRNLLKRMALSLVHESEAREQEMIPEGGEASLKPVHLGFTEIGQDTKGRHLFASLPPLYFLAHLPVFSNHCPLSLRIMISRLRPYLSSSIPWDSESKIIAITSDFS